MWLRELRTHSNPDAKVFLIGNKIDLENERKITREQGENFAKTNKLHSFLESSAKTGFNAKKVFIKAAKVLYDEHLKYKNIEDNANPNSGEQNEGGDTAEKLKPVGVNDKKKKGCC